MHRGNRRRSARRSETTSVQRLAGRCKPLREVRSTMQHLTRTYAMFNRRLISLLTLVTAIGCSDRALTTSLGHEASLAKGGPPAPQRVDFTITDAGLSLQSDGKGIYRDGVCGVFGSLSTDVMFLGPDYTRIPKSQQAACAGIAPRAASVTLALRHISDNPHADEEASPSGFNVVNV